MPKISLKGLIAVSLLLLRPSLALSNGIHAGDGPVSEIETIGSHPLVNMSAPEPAAATKDDSERFTGTFREAQDAPGQLIFQVETKRENHFHPGTITESVTNYFVRFDGDEANRARLRHEAHRLLDKRVTVYADEGRDFDSGKRRLTIDRIQER